MAEHLQYGLENDVLVSRVATEAEVEAATDRAGARVENGKYALRSCWNCNAAHIRFLEDVKDDHLFNCFDCGHWFFNGLDLSGSEGGTNEET